MFDVSDLRARLKALPIDGRLDVLYGYVKRHTLFEYSFNVPMRAGFEVRLTWGELEEILDEVAYRLTLVPVRHAAG